jgi:hypothetical protein
MGLIYLFFLLLNLLNFAYLYIGTCFACTPRFPENKGGRRGAQPEHNIHKEVLGYIIYH